jgi:hypothetical protein
MREMHVRRLHAGSVNVHAIHGNGIPLDGNSGSHRFVAVGHLVTRGQRS